MKQRKWVLQNCSPDADRITIDKLLHQEKLCEFSEVVYADTPDGYGPEFIPVGDIPFVHSWLQSNYKKDMAPIEVPDCLRKQEYLFRGYNFMEKKDIPFGCKQKKFIKNVSRLKEFNNALYEGMIPSWSILPEGVYLVSDWINILSEFRVFVYKDKIQAVQPYLGMPLAFPEPFKIWRMVKDFTADPKRPGAYAMDIAVCKDNSSVVHTVILEVHPLVSCGLYGFCSMELPDMLAEGIRYYTET